MLRTNITAPCLCHSQRAFHRRGVCMETAWKEREGGRETDRQTDRGTHASKGCRECCLLLTHVYRAGLPSFCRAATLSFHPCGDEGLASAPQRRLDSLCLLHHHYYHHRRRHPQLPLLHLHLHLLVSPLTRHRQSPLRRPYTSHLARQARSLHRRSIPGLVWHHMHLFWHHMHRTCGVRVSGSSLLVSRMSLAVIQQGFNTVLSQSFFGGRHA